jgi:hypothetical protein
LYVLVSSDEPITPRDPDSIRNSQTREDGRATADTDPSQAFVAKEGELEGCRSSADEAESFIELASSWILSVGVDEFVSNH